MSKKPRLARAAGLIGAATMLSRLLGLVREQLLAALLGATVYADAFFVAFRIPNLLRDLFAEGALAQAFVPTFKDSLKNQGAPAAYELGNRVAGTLFCVIGAVVLVAGIFAAPIVEVLAGDFSPQQFELTILLTRIMLPFLAVVSLSAVAMGMLNAQDRYAAPALAPAMFNVMSISTGVVLYVIGAGPRWVAIGWSIGTLLGGLAQLGIQIPPLWRLKFRPRLAADVLMRDPGVRRVALLMAPAVAGLAAVQVNIVINTTFATQETGAVAWLNYAFRFMQLPIGVFGVAIATVSTTRYADAAADRDTESLVRHMVEGLRLVAFLTVPATIGLWLLSEEVMRLIYQRGRFEAFDTLMSAEALRLYVVGLVFYAGVKVLAPAFYAMRRARIAVYASISAVAGNLALIIPLHDHYGFRILALGTALAAILNFLVLYVMFHRQLAKVPHAHLLGHLLRTVAAGAVMAAAVWGAREGLDQWLGHQSLIARLVVALGPVTVGALVYAGAAAALRIDELEQLVGKLRRRLRK